MGLPVSKLFFPEKLLVRTCSIIILHSVHCTAVVAISQITQIKIVYICIFVLQMCILQHYWRERTTRQRSCCRSPSCSFVYSYTSQSKIRDLEGSPSIMLNLSNVRISFVLGDPWGSYRPVCFFSRDSCHMSIRSNRTSCIALHRKDVRCSLNLCSVDSWLNRNFSSFFLFLLLFFYQIFCATLCVAGHQCEKKLSEIKGKYVRARLSLSVSYIMTYTRRTMKSIRLLLITEKRSSAWSLSNMIPSTIIGRSRIQA